MPRYYAVIRPSNTGNKDLAELLVEAGMARARGIRITIPRSPSLADFKRMEARAKQQKMGIYGGNKPTRVNNSNSSRTGFETQITQAATQAPEDSHANLPDLDLGISDDMSASLAIPGITLESKTTSNDPLTSTDPPTHTTAQISPDSAEKKIDINNASRIQLMKLPGIGEKTARAIIEARPFSSIEDLRQVGNIGPTTFERLKGLVIVQN
jgi:competence protein ComEA